MNHYLFCQGITMKKSIISCCVAMGLMSSFSANASTEHKKLLHNVEDKVIEWRRDFHQNPELGNREVRTAKIVAEHLKNLGMEVETGIAYTGVVGILKGAKSGPTVMLRADMDALPVTEQVDLPFKSIKTTNYRGVDVGIMHA
jgi:metal-dependent amidase/aminoacylase/carboxypeptidase family protein